ncbi:MAG TPA: NusA-like transcription termination signal-binding factor [Candidatus Nanoarchaeia archaeon]|nr:NusA-like transcription termination signal-binding factor [Candidatus Nanoarchaeia archaeon]
MGRLILNQEELGLSSIMERLTRARVKDCFKDEDTIYFVVAEGEMGKALGKGGVNIKRVQNELGRRIKVIEYADNLVDFVRNIILPLKVAEIIDQNGTVIIRDDKKKTKSLLIGRGRKNLTLIKRAVSRFFNVEVVVE